MKHVTYAIGERVVPNYEAVYRTTRKDRKLDGVEVVPIIQYKDKPSEILIIANFRPPAKKFCIEFPSGLIESEDYEENAKRELL